MALGENIKHYRKLNYLSQEKIAEFIGVSRQAVTRWETNQSSPSTENLMKLIDLFNITLDELINDKIEETISDSAARMDEKKDAREYASKVKSQWKRNIMVLWGSTVVILIIAFLLSKKLILWTLVNVVSLIGCVVLGSYMIGLLIRALNKYMRD